MISRSLSPDSIKSVVLVTGRHPHFGGGVQSFINLASGLKSAGIDVLCIVDNTDFPSALLEEKGLRVAHADMKLHGFKRFWRIILREFKLCWMIFRQRPDILHLNDLSVFRLMTLTAFLSRLPTFIHVRFPVGEDLLGWALRFNRYPVSLIYVSAAILQQNSKWLDKNSNKALGYSVHNAVNMTRFSQKPAPWTKYKNIGMIANIVPYKRVIDFVDIAAGINSDDPGVTFWIAGDTSINPAYYDQVQKHARNKGLTENTLSFLGSRKDIPDLIENSFAIIHPAVNEAFGLVVIEAMAVGRPVLVANSAGPAEILADEKGGYILDAGDISGFSEKLTKLMKNPDLYQQQCRAAADKAREKYSIATHTQNILAVYADFKENVFSQKNHKKLGVDN